MPQLQRPPDLDDDYRPIPIRSSVTKSSKPPDIEDEEELSLDELLANAKLSLNKDDTTDSTTKPVEAKSRGFIESFSDAMSPLSEPLTDFFSRQGKVSADILDRPRLNRTPFEAQVEGFKAGATEGLGNVVDSMTSPINLAVAIASMGQGAAAKYGLTKIAQGLGYGVKGLSAAMTGAGIKHTAEAESIFDTGMGIAETAGGLTGVLHTPGAKPKAKVPDPLPVKPPIIESRVTPKPSVRANLDGTFTDKSTGQPFDPASLKGLEPAAVVPEGVDPNTGEIISPRRATKRMGAPDLGPTPEALKPPDLPEVVPETAAQPVATEPPSTFESWLDRLKSERGVLNVTEINDALHGREAQTPESVAPTKQQPEIPSHLEPEAPAAEAFPNRAGGEFLEGMSSESITDFIRRQSGTEGYSYDTGQRILRHAQDILDSRAAGMAQAEANLSDAFSGDRMPTRIPPRSNRITQMVDESDSAFERRQQRSEEVDPTPQTDRWRQHEENQRRNSGFGDPPEPDYVPADNWNSIDTASRFESGAPYPTTSDAVHDLSTPNLREFINSNADRGLTFYARGVLQERTSRQAQPTTSHTGGEHDFGDTVNDERNWRSYRSEPESKAGLTLDELEATKRTPAFERLGKIIGEDRAQQLTSGERELGPEPPAARYKGKKIRPSEASSWNDWGDSIIRSTDKDPSKPGITVEPHSMTDVFPKQFEVIYRDPSGTPIAVLRTNLDGTGISELAVNSKLGLRRGKVAFEILKPAFDRGISKASGSTSDHTKNLIERVRKLYERAKSEKGEVNLNEIYEAINDLIDKVSSSKFGQAVGRFIRDERGSVNVKDPLDALKELFEKSKKGTLTPEELAQAKKLAKEQEAPKAQEISKLPQELQGARPRFNVGADSYIPKFADDLDKALYITAQRTKSPSDAKYLKFAMEQTGLNEQQVRNAGAQVRSVIKRAVVNHEPGSIDIPSVYRSSMAKASKAEPVVPTKQGVTSKEYLEGKSQVDTGPLIPENVGVTSTADVVTQSLSKRLQKAVDEAGQPNTVAPEEISQLVDEGTKVLNRMPNGPEKQGVIRQVLGANKALLTSWDVSAPGRQGKAFILNKAWWTSLDDMVRAWGSPEAAKMINDSITEHPSGYFTKPISETGQVGKSFAEKAGLELTSTEEMFNAKLGAVFEKYSGIGKSSRAHTAFLNKLRSDQFVSMMEGAKRVGMNPETNLHIASKYATFINDATGRGSVNIGKWKLERNLGVLNDIFFAPKNMAGQIRTWKNVLNPMNYAAADPVMRKQALKSLLAVAGLGLGVGEIARLAGAQVNNDPTNSDFRKIRIGDLRIDPFGGYQQFPVAAMKFLAGQSTSSISGKTTDLTAGRFGQQTRGSVAARFFTNRLSPVGSFIWAWMDGREFDGKPFEAKRALYERIFPIAAKDIWELAQEDPFLAAILAPTTLMGLTGTQHYSGRN